MCLFLHKHTMHNFSSIGSSLCLTLCLFHKRSTPFKSGPTVQSQLAPTTLVQTIRKHICLNKGPKSIREKITTLQAELERLSTLVVSLVASQDQLQFQQRLKRQTSTAASTTGSKDAV